MKKLDEIRNEVAADHGWINYDNLNEAYRNHIISQCSFDDFFDDVAKVYADELLTETINNNFFVKAK